MFIKIIHKNKTLEETFHVSIYVINLKIPCKIVVNVTWVTYMSILSIYICNKNNVWIFKKLFGSGPSVDLAALIQVVHSLWMLEARQNIHQVM